MAKRTKKRKEAEEAVVEAKEEGDQEALAKLNKRTLRVTPQHGEEAKKLLSLMGIPYVDAPCEAEAQCAALVSSGFCYGAGSEDMDSLTLGVPLLLRHLNYSESRGLPILEIRLDKVLEGLNMSMEQFIDLCILLGCDYCDSIRGIGPVRAVQLIEKYGTIEAILETLDQEKYKVPDNFPFREIRELFKHPEVADPSTLDIKWTAPDEEGLIEFLVNQKGFSEERVRRGVEKLNKCRSSAVQDRITSFFSAAPKAPKAKPAAAATGKDAKKAGAKKGAASAAKASSSSSASSSSVAKPISSASSSAPPSSSTNIKTEESEAPTSTPSSTNAGDNDSKPSSQTEATESKPAPVKTEEKEKGPVHPFFQPRKAAKKAESSTPAASTADMELDDKERKERSKETAPETEIKVVRKGRIIEDDGDE